MRGIGAAVSMVAGVVALAAGGCVQVVEPMGQGGSSSASTSSASGVGGGGAAGCTSPFAECDGGCVDVSANNQHCGGCGQACAAGEVCDGSGRCALSCQVGMTRCGDRCVDTQESTNHCGGCGIPCPAGHVCSEGQCALTCHEGLTECGGTCVDTQESNKHCGGCDQACGEGELCDQGHCAVSCGGGTTLCGVKCVDITSHQEHCGGCEMPCTGGTCTAGTCTGPFIGSKILGAADGQTINAWVGSPGREWKLCYRKSDDGASASAFHSNCDNKGPTITVAELSTGRKIGGYGPVSWTGSTSYKGNSTGFLFSLTNNHKHTQNGNSNWMYDRSTYGPTFGGGHDWHVQSDMNGGYCNIGHTFNCRTGSYGSTACQNDFCGTYNGWSITELEVWYF